MKPSINALNLIKKYEGFNPKAYLCPAGLPTIGYGSRFWMDGSRVKLGQEISIENAEKLVMYHLAVCDEFIPAGLNQNQCDSLYSFMYNVGVINFKKSELRKLILANPKNPLIADEFNKWVFSKSKKLDGLVKRRKAESDLYFKPITI